MTVQADVAALVMQEGLAHLCLITAHMTVLRAKIEQPIPRKRRGSSSQHDKSLLRFYDSAMQARGAAGGGGGGGGCWHLR